MNMVYRRFPSWTILKKFEGALSNLHFKNHKDTFASKKATISVTNLETCLGMVGFPSPNQWC